jgi:hypothetical protein
VALLFHKDNRILCPTKLDKAVSRKCDPRMWVLTICMYARMPLIWHQWDWTGAELSNILGYQTLSILT